jgi:hypothetical protein
VSGAIIAVSQVITPAHMRLFATPAGNSDGSILAVSADT